MAKYIKHEKIWEMLHAIGGCDAESESWADGWDKAIDTAIEELEKLPTADVQEVKHGEWVRDEFDMLCCSECNEEPEFENITSYCPYCGAKMDGKDGKNENI